MLRSLFLLFLLFPLATYAQRDSIPSYYSKGMEGYKSGNFESFLSYFRELNQIRPNHPTIMYNLSAAYALNNQPAASLEILDMLFRMDTDLWSNVHEDRDFDNLHDTKGWISMDSKVEGYRGVIEHSTVDKVISVSDHMESVEKIGEHLFFGSVNSRNIYKQEEDVVEWQKHENIPDMFAVMGLAFDQENGRLWACTAALPQMSKYDESLEGRSSLLEFDVKSGKLLTSIVMEDATFGDLILADNGVLISDSRGNKIYRAISGAAKVSLVIDLSSMAFNLQGLTISGDQLFVADYIQGIYQIDMQTSEASLLSSNSPVSLKGIDGLYFLNNRLIGLQNGTKPNRVLELFVSGSNIENVRVIDQNRSEFGEPTQGYINEHALFFIADSPWGAYTKENEFEGARSLTLLKIK